MATNRHVSEGMQLQGIAEEIAYQIVVTPWGSTPTSGSTWVIDTTNGGTTNVTSTVMPTGVLSISGDTITMPILKSLTLDHFYRVNCRFNIGTNIYDALIDVQAEY